MAQKVEMHGDVAVIALKGKLMGGSDTQKLHGKVKELIDEGNKKLIINLGGVKWMNSSGLGALMGALTTAKNNGAELKLSNVTDKVHHLFIITKLQTIFDTYDSVVEAASSFK